MADTSPLPAHPPPAAPSPPSIYPSQPYQQQQQQQSVLLPSSIFSSPPSALSPTLAPALRQLSPSHRESNAASLRGSRAPATYNPGVRGPTSSDRQVNTSHDGMQSPEAVVSRGGTKDRRAKSFDSLESLDWADDHVDGGGDEKLDADTDVYDGNVYEDQEDADKEQENSDDNQEEDISQEMEDESESGFSLDGYKIDLAMLGHGGHGRKIGFGSGKHRRFTRGVPSQNVQARKSGATNDDGNACGTANRPKQMSEVNEGVLNGGKPSSDARHEEVVPCSEDDGPEDFTLNMGAWLRGDRDWKQRQGEIADCFGESVLEPLGTSTPMPMKALNREIPEMLSAEEQKGTKTGGVGAIDENAQQMSNLRAEIEKIRADSEEQKALFRRVQEEKAELAKLNTEMQAQLQERERPSPVATPNAAKINQHTTQVPPALVQDHDIAENPASSNDKGEVLDSALKASHETIRQLRADMSRESDMYKTVVQGLREDLDRLKAQLEAESSKSAALEGELERNSKRCCDLDQLAQETKEQMGQHDKERSNLSEQLRETRRIIQMVEQENDRLIDKDAEQTKILKAMEERLEASRRESEEAATTINNLQNQRVPGVNSGRDEEEGLVSSKDHISAVQKLVERNNHTLSSLKTKHTKDLQILRNEQKVKIETLEADLLMAKSNGKTSEEELRSAIRVLSAKLEKTNLSARTNREDLEEARALATTAVMKENELVNTAMEAKFAETIEARETEWRRRVALLLKDRDRMSRVLMSEWGRAEMGPAAPAVAKRKAGDGNAVQAYKYRYVKR